MRRLSALYRGALTQIDAAIVHRRHGSSCLVLVVALWPPLALLCLMQLYAAAHPWASQHYRSEWMVPALWLQAALLAWLAAMGCLGWRHRRCEERMPWLVQATVVPALWGMAWLSVAHGLKDSPMGMMLLVALVGARALFTLRRLCWAFGGALVIVVGAEVLTSMGLLPASPMLSHPIAMGGELAPWWALWVRLVFNAAALPFSGMLFYLAGTVHRRSRELETLVRTDALTGLANRREFMTCLQRESHRHARSGRPLSVVLCDVDHFKQVNDRWGHPAGDAVLAHIGRILRASTREAVDTAARYGGEEFVLLLPETDVHGAIHVAEKIAVALREQHVIVDGRPLRVTQSVGVAQVVDGDTEWALKVADRNLYQAKLAGRDRIVASVAFASTSASEEAASWP